MSLEKELINSKKTDANSLIAKAEETHYPEDDFVVNELIKLLSKESREFGKTYNNFMNQIKLEIAK
nr:hypothetical protein [bacterium]